MRSKSTENLLEVVYGKEHQILVKNLNKVVKDLDISIDASWIRPITLAFEASGYMVIKDRFQNKCVTKDMPFTINLGGGKKTTLNDEKWIYESPDNGKTVFRRPFGNPDAKREQIDVKNIPGRSVEFDKTNESILR